MLLKGNELDYELDRGGRGPEMDVGASGTKRMKRKSLEGKKEKEKEVVGQYVYGSLLFTEKMNQDFIPGSLKFQLLPPIL